MELTTVRVNTAVLGVDTLVVASAAFVIGLQSALFAVFTKIYGVNEGFLPSNPRLDRVRRFISLELGLLIGIICIIIGTAGLVLAAIHWSDARFGHLDPTDALRSVVPSVTLLIVGFQITLASLFVSILSIRRIRRSPALHGGTVEGSDDVSRLAAAAR